MKAAILTLMFAVTGAAVLPAPAAAGILSDLVVAPADQAEAVAKASVPSKAFGGIDIKGVDSVKFLTLHSIVTGESNESLRPRYQPVVQVSDEGPWVVRIPPELVSRLARLRNAERVAIGKRWARTEEFALGRWSERAVLDVLRRISKLAKQPDDSHRALFLWVCL